MSRARVTFLGTGTSHGVPMIGCACPTCRSDDPRDQRWRPSIRVELGAGGSILSVLVDTSPDLRAQALRFGVDRVDAVVFTHPHADHILGLDEMRRYNDLQRASIPCYGDARTLEEVKRTFQYAFGPLRDGGGVPRLDLVTVDGPFSIGGCEFVPVPILHGPEIILGFRIGDFAYLTDCSGIPDSSWPLLEGVRVLAIDALRERPHPTHFSLAEALEAARRIGAARTCLTHICHDLAHAATQARLPSGVEVAFDGLALDIG
ncbi:MAG: MBL fold metallo-hydrolase [Vicinamibacterales bacterium]